MYCDIIDGKIVNPSNIKGSGSREFDINYHYYISCAKGYLIYDPASDNIIVNPNYQEEQRQKERERIANLTMTALDFIGFLQQKGLTLEEINAYLESNLAIKMQLTYCQNVYCGVVLQLMPITVGEVTITQDDVITAFKVKNGVE